MYNCHFRISKEKIATYISFIICIEYVTTGFSRQIFICTVKLHTYRGENNEFRLLFLDTIYRL